MKTFQYLISAASLFCLCISPSALAVDSSRVNCIVHGYSSKIEYAKKSIRTGQLYLDLKNGVVIPWDEGDPSLDDTVGQLYPQFRPVNQAAAKASNPGILINPMFMHSVYGADELSIRKNLVRVRWMPLSLHQDETYLSFNFQNGAASALTKVSYALDALPDDLKQYVMHGVTTFVWQRDQNNNRLSASAYGISVRLDPHYRDYWRTAAKDAKGVPIFKNRIPERIIKIFEKYGFIWGGRWQQFDTTYFEFRPEFSYHACILQRDPQP